MGNGGLKLVLFHDGPEIVQAGSGCFVKCEVSAPDVAALIGQIFINFYQVLIELMVTINGLK
jgi:hypothetical protein